MKIAIIGCGAMGSVYAGLLASAGHEVWAVDTLARARRRDPRQWSARRRRLGRSHRPDQRHDRRSRRRSCDLVILATKAMHVAQAAASLEAAARAGHARPVDPERPGRPGHGRRGARARARDGRRRRRLRRLHEGARARAPQRHGAGPPGRARRPGRRRAWRTVAEVWRSGGFRVKCFDDIDQLVWEKLICNVVLLRHLRGDRAHDRRSDRRTRTPGRSPRAAPPRPSRWRASAGIKLDFDEPVAYVRDFGSKIPNARPSMLLDHHGEARFGDRRDQRRDPAGGEGGRPRGAVQRGDLGPRAGEGAAARLRVTRLSGREGQRTA